MAAGLDRPDYDLYSKQMTDDVKTVLGGGSWSSWLSQ
jgi:hypothetical protein